MEFEIKNIKKSVNDIMRIISYKPTYIQKDEEVSIVRQLTKNDYPRFHLYIKIISDDQNKGKSFVTSAPQDKWRLNTLIFNLHLDQKKPLYKGSSAHSGEYDSDLVENEAERIKRLLI